jgi:hypothetical protein
MTTINTTPINKSFLSNNKFDFVLDRIPNFTFFVQSVNLPSLALQSTTVNTPFAQLSIPGNQLSFGQLTMSFMIDENMQSWYELYNWMFQLGNPTSLNKRGQLTGVPGSNTSITSDGTLFIKTNSNNPNWKVNFYEMYPNDLGDITFSTTDSQEFVTSTVTFNYTYYVVSQA